MKHLIIRGIGIAVSVFALNVFLSKVNGMIPNCSMSNRFRYSTISTT